jgi:beta-glucosidase
VTVATGGRRKCDGFLVQAHVLLNHRVDLACPACCSCNICDERPKGYPNFPCQVKDSAADRSNFSSAVATAKAADVAVLFLGNDQTTEAENFDRFSLALPGAQQALLEAVGEVQPNIVLVLQNGGPIAVDWAVSSRKVRAILDAFQPGELGGDAILNLLSGAAVPSGKLPYLSAQNS